MNYFKSLLLTAFALLAFAACDTDDLRDDVDNLKGRVESLEAQVTLLNDNMTAIKRLLEGGQTITELTNTDGTYTLKLSDGSTITLTQGSKGEVKYPEITVNDEGQWVVNGEVLMQNGVPVQAVGTKGDNGITPKFRITDEGSFWQVSYDEGTTWGDVLDVNNEKVSAVSDGSDDGSSADSFFEEVGVDPTGEFFVIKLKDQPEAISIPIVKELLCEIIEPETGMKNGYWEIGYGNTVTTTVKVKGENIITTAPAGWVVTVSDVDASTNIATLSITAPASAVTTRATADNSSDVTVQVNKGANWAVDKIQVKAVEIIDSYYALYDAGKTITINGMAINKETFGDATFITTGNTEITQSGVYFIDPEVEAVYNATGSYSKMIIIGNSSFKKSALKVTKQIKLAAATNNVPEAFICRNLKFDATTLDNYPLVQNKEGAFGNVIFNDCKVLIHSGRPFTYITSNTKSISNFSFENCTIPVSSTDNNKFIISLSGSEASYGSLSFKNNIFYCPDENKAASGFKLVNGNKATTQEMTIANNTFINIYTATTFYVYLSSLPNVYATNNLFYAKATMPTNGGVFRLTNKPVGNTCSNNIIYKAENTQNWQIFFGGISNGFEGAEEVKTITADPFDGGTFDLTNGIFIPSAEYSEYGASIN